MNLFTGMTGSEEVSLLLTFVVFNGFVLLEAFALAAFYIASRPRRGRVRTAALWHMAAALMFLMSLIATVWAAPAEKSFLNADDPTEPFLSGDRFTKIAIAILFAVVGIVFMGVGAAQARAQRATAARAALLEA